MPQFAPDIEELLGGPAGAPEIAITSGGKPLATIGGAYEGASRFSRELATWNPSRLSADRDILPSKYTVDSRVRDALRNDSYVVAGANLHRNGIVGAFYMLNAKPETKILFGKDDPVWEQEFQEEVEDKFTLSAESPNHWLDASRMNTLTGLVRLAVGISVASGEVLASAEWIRDSSRPFNTAIQMIDTDRLGGVYGSYPTGKVESPFFRGGIERDQYGAPLAYWILLAHPSDYTSLGDNYRFKRVPIRKPWGRLQMLHIIEQTRPDQTRGIAQMVSALQETRMAKNFRQIVLQNAVINATYAATIESELPSEMVFGQLGGQDTVGSAVAQYCDAYLAALNQYVSGSKNLTIDGAKIPHLFPGTKLKLQPAATGGPLGTAFEASLHRYLAANMEVSYEELTGDLSNTNYAGIKTAIAKTERAMAAKKKATADRFASMIYRLWLEEMLNKRQITSMPRNAPSYYEGLNADAYSSCDWIGASKGQIDELKETQAAALRIQMGLSTYEAEMARLGKYYRKVFRQQKREMEERKELGIDAPPSNAAKNMMNSVTGQPEDKGAGA